MTHIDEILIAANQIANTGKKPTVALIKAKLKQSIPLPIIINTLKNWQHQPDFASPIKTQNNNNEQQAEEEQGSLINNDIVKALIQETMSEELKQMKKDLSDMKQLIKDLTEQLSKK